jgi:bacteriocin-like protein
MEKIEKLSVDELKKIIGGNDGPIPIPTITADAAGNRREFDHIGQFNF